MLIRVVLSNFFSFGDQVEFQMMPYQRLQTLNHHKYDINEDFSILKLTSIYGANGAGKSNLIKSVSLLKKLITGKDIPYELQDSEFRFTKKESLPQTIAIEFIEEGIPFLYALQIQKDHVIAEELYESSLGRGLDKLLFERKINVEGKTTLKFSNEMEDSAGSDVLKSILLEEFVNAHEPVFRLLSNRDNKYLSNVKKAYNWFYSTLQIVSPSSKPRALAHRMDTDSKFKLYSNKMMCSMHLGISGLRTEKKTIEQFFGEDNDSEIKDLKRKVEDSPNKIIGIRTINGDEIILVKEDDEIWVKSLSINHKYLNKQDFWFELDDESDGTVRLLDFVPLFHDISKTPRIYLVDEIERSIHPVLIKELLKKFSHQEDTLGQLIFTTHESNLLDQSIFRQDEIWFTEKDRRGSTKMYSLSEFKEHKTIDIQKGYLNGRYGAIPFIGNLQDLKWTSNDTCQ